MKLIYMACRFRISERDFEECCCLILNLGDYKSATVEVQEITFAEMHAMHVVSGDVAEDLVDVSWHKVKSANQFLQGTFKFNCIGCLLLSAFRCDLFRLHNVRHTQIDFGVPKISS